MVKNKAVSKLCRGDIIKFSFDPTIGHEQSGYRPALVISDTLFHQATGSVLCIPITSKKKGLLFEVEILGKEIKGVALLHGTRMMDLQHRKFIFVEKARPAIYAAVQIILNKIILE